MGNTYDDENGQDNGLDDIQGAISNTANRLGDIEKHFGNKLDAGRGSTNNDVVRDGPQETNQATGGDGTASEGKSGQKGQAKNQDGRVNPNGGEGIKTSAEMNATKNATAGAASEGAAGTAGGATAGSGAASSGASAGGASAGGAAAGSTTAGATGGAAAGGSAAGGVAATGAAASPVGAVAAAVVAAIALIPLSIAGMVMIAGLLLTYFNPLNLVKVVEQVAKNVGYSIVDELEQNVEEFLYVFKTGKAEPTSNYSLQQANVDIPVAYEDYNPLNPQERAMIEEYKLIAVALSRAYTAEVKKIEERCKEKKYDWKMTEEYINRTYPEGWKTVFKDVNYAEVMALLHFYVEKHEDKWKEREGVLDGIKNDILHSDKTGNYTFTYTGIYLSEISELLFKESKQKYYCDTAVVVKEKDGTEYLEVEIKPFCWNEMYEVVNIAPNDEYDKIATYADFHAAMNKSMKVITLDMWGNPPAIYYTIGMDRPGVGWNNMFRGIEITELLLSKNVLSVMDEKNRELTYSLIRAAGYDDYIAAGICGYLHNISGFNTMYLESTDTIGIGQWTGAKAAELYKYADSMNMSPTDIHVQINFLLKDMETLPEHQLQEIQASGNEKEASIRFAVYYGKEPAFMMKQLWAETEYANPDSKKYTAWERYGKTDLGYVKDAETIQGLAVIVYTKYKDQSIYAWPMPSSLLVISNFGAMGGSVSEDMAIHTGIDIEGKAGAQIVSVSDGTVIEVGTDENYNKYIKIQYLNNCSAEYLNLGSVIVNEGDTVKKGQLIGYLAKSGTSEKPYLHFAIYSYNPIDETTKPTSPWRFLEKPEYVIEDEACTVCDVNENTHDPKYTDKKCSICSGDGIVLIYDDWLNSDYWMTSYAGCSQCGGKGRVEYMSGPDDYVDYYNYVPGSGYYGTCNHYPSGQEDK